MCERRKLKINVGKSKMMEMSDTGEKGNTRIRVKERRHGRSEFFSVSENGFCFKWGRSDVELNHKSMKIRNCAKECMEKYECFNDDQKGMYEGNVASTAQYGSEAWVFENKVKNKVHVQRCHV